MNTKLLVTQNARKFKTISQHMINCGSVLLLSTLLLVISCAKSDDSETIDNEIPVASGSLIMYTDIEPDFTSENLNDTYALDLNNDGIVDFTLESEQNLLNWDYNDPIIAPQYFLYLDSGSNDASGSISVTPWLPNPVPLDSGKEIFNLAGYTNGESYENWGFFIIGVCGDKEESCYQDWKDKNDKYLGLRFAKNGKIHYGWVRLDVTSATQWVIKDYAYNATPNKPILAGQKE